MCNAYGTQPGESHKFSVLNKVRCAGSRGPPRNLIEKKGHRGDAVADFCLEAAHQFVPVPNAIKIHEKPLKAGLQVS